MDNPQPKSGNYTSKPRINSWLAYASGLLTELFLLPQRYASGLAAYCNRRLIITSAITKINRTRLAVSRGNCYSP